MKEIEILWYLIYGLFVGSYSIKTFCSEFTRIYNLEIDYGDLTNDENKEFGDLCEMAGRFSDNLGELQIPNMYFNEREIREKAKQVVRKLR